MDQWCSIDAPRTHCLDPTGGHPTGRLPRASRFLSRTFIIMPASPPSFPPGQTKATSARTTTSDGGAASSGKLVEKMGDLPGRSREILLGVAAAASIGCHWVVAAPARGGVGVGVLALFRLGGFQVASSTEFVSATMG
jgi:hypothetical protein